MDDNRDSVLVDVGQTEINENKTTKVMPVYQILRTFSNACDQKNLAQIKKLSVDNIILQDIPVLQNVNDDVLSDTKSRNGFKHQVIDLILDRMCDKFHNDYNELLFFASAKCDLTRLQESIIGLKRMSTDLYNVMINETRYSDSALLFLLKYGNINKESFLSCVKVLIEEGVDVNKYDVKGKAAVDYVAALHESYKDNPNINDMLKNVAQLFLQKEVFKPDNKKTEDFLTNEMKIDMDKYNFAVMDDETKLFYWLNKNKTAEFLNSKNIKKYMDSEHHENTLLQIASKKTDNMLPIVQFLLKNGADPNKTTKWNPLTPLELAAMYNNSNIFEEILKNKRTTITQKQYNNFVRWRSQPMKAKLFEILLESDKLETTLIYDRTGNSPLHYAILFCHKTAIQKLLRRQSPLILKNKSGLSALDIIDPEDLEKYFDCCLALDNYTSYFSDINYKMRFRFNCLIDDTDPREIGVVSKIGKHPSLEHLLTHPFIHTFIYLKWFRIKLYFWIILFFQAILFLLFTLLFYRLSRSSSVEYSICIFLTLVNIVIKVPIFLYFHLKNSRPVFFAMNRVALHTSLEMFIILTMIGSFFQKQFRAFVFVEMAVSFLLTAGYHPKLSKWSLMLQQVFKTFTILLIFFSLIVAAFGLGFHILFPKDFLYKDIFGAIFITYIMTTGEINVEEEMGFDNAGIGGYMLFFIFAMSMSLVIVNFWTGVAVADIERIEKNSEINASKNVIIFMLFIDFLYSVHCLAKIRNYFPNPLLFLRIKSDGFIFHTTQECGVDFFVNKERQFEEKRNFPTKVDNDCFNKIRNHYHKLVKVSNEQEILKKLEELTNMMMEIKTKCFKNNQNDAASSDNRTKKFYNKPYKKKESKPK